jgi:acetolactate synthase-1/2/3 large subunit
MNVADYIIKFLSEKGVDTVFMVSGGQAMFLVDAVYKNRGIKTICTHHEQSAAMAAEAYGRITGKLGFALVTAGPGSVNAINGVVGGWTDSSPMLILSGQSALSCVQYQQKTRIRQYGIQGINIKPLVENVTKYFITIDDPAKLLYYLEKAYNLATSGRPGPVWIDVPLDVQNMEIPYEFFDKFITSFDHLSETVLRNQVVKTYEILSQSKKPIILAGQGVRIANAAEELRKVAETLSIPVLTSRLGIDIIESDNDLYVGRPGNYGERAANFSIQNADLIISIGCRLASALVGHDPKNFGKNAKKISVEIDHEELQKPGIVLDLKINCDAKLFLNEMLAQIESFKRMDLSSWVARNKHWKKVYPVVLSSYKDEKPVNSYYFTDKLSQLASKDDMILVDTGSCFHVACQVWKIKKGQRFLTTGGLSSMGYWVAGLGACAANNFSRTIVITGDGSLQMNIQELATIKHNNLPIKVFSFNNNGYLLIRHTQKNFMDGRFMGESPETGVWCPDLLRLGDAYGIKSIRIDSVDEVDAKIKEALAWDGPVLCDVMTPEWQLLIPRVSSEKMPDGRLVPRPYEDMFPYLERDLLEKEMAD